MSIDELTQRTTVKFPRDLDEEEFKDLMKYLGRKLPGSINYSIKTNYTTGSLVNENDNRTLMYSVKVSGVITKKGILSSTGFNCESRTSEEYKRDILTGLEFQTIPGYELEEHNTKEIQLWDDVKRLIEKYFIKESCI